MRIKKLCGMILFIAILSLGLAPMASAAVNITVTAPAQVAAGAQFDVTVGVDTTVVDNAGTPAYLSGAALGIDYDPAVLEVVGTFGAADGDQSVASDLFNFNNSKVVDSRTTPGTPTEAWPRIGNNDTTGGILYLSGANAGYDAGATPTWPFTAGTAKTLFKVKFMVKAGVAADTSTNLTLIQTTPPADTNTGWNGTDKVWPLVGTNENWADTPDVLTDDFFDIPYAFGAAASVTVGGTVNVNLPLKAGWNMISLPVTPADNSLATLFPEATIAYEYVPGTGYLSVTALSPGTGYWIKIPADKTYTISGTAFTTYTDDLPVNKWSLVGAVNGTVTPTTDPADSINIMYEYVPGTGYISVTQLGAGKAYWVKIKAVAGRDFVSFTVGQ